MNLENAMREWGALLGEGNVLDGPAAAIAYGSDASAIHRSISGGLKVVDAAMLPELMRIAVRNTVAIYPISTGKNWGYGTALPATDNCVVVDLSGMTKIIHFDADLGVVTLEPGVTQGQLADFLDAGGHRFLVPVTGAGPQCSIVGNALERGYGVTPFVDHFGAVTDLEAVLPDGSLYRTALREAAGEDLARLFKWGIGTYSAGLFTQSNFGIVTRMTVALARRPESVKVCLFSLKSDAQLEDAVVAIQSVIAKLPGIVGAFNLMNQHRVLAMSAPFPEDQLGSDGLIPKSVIESLGKQYQIFPWTAFGTLYGAKGVVSAAQKEIRKQLSGIASRLMFLSPANARTLAAAANLLPGEAGRRLGRTARTLAMSLELVAGRPNETALPLCYWRNPEGRSEKEMNPSADGCGLIWYAPLVPMRPGSVRKYVEMVQAVARKHRMEPLITLTSISDKVFDSTVPLIFKRSDPAAASAAKACYQELLELGREMGCFPYRVGVDSMKTLAGYMSDSASFQARLRAAIDADGLLSPGRYA